jgi:hypothetical protein
MMTIARRLRSALQLSLLGCSKVLTQMKSSGWPFGASFQLSNRGLTLFMILRTLFGEIGLLRLHNILDS